MTNHFWRAMLAAAAVAAVLASATSAQATTVNFTYFDSAHNPVAHGSFSYATGATGVLDYAALSAFDVIIGADTYTLADVTGFTDYKWFAYDTAGNDFVTSGSLCGFAGCGFVASLAAINAAGTSGFFFTAAPGTFADYKNFSPTPFQSIEFSKVASVPEPASLALVGLALVGVAATRRRKLRRQAQLAL